VTAVRGASSRPHLPGDAEQAEFQAVVGTSFMRARPAVVVVRPGPCSAAVLAAARGWGAATVAFHPDGGLKDSTPYQNADVVLTLTRLAAGYLREAFGLPCTHLPPVVATGQAGPGIQGSDGVVCDGSFPGSGLSVFGQIAEDLGRKRPAVPFVVIGGSGSVPIPGGGTVRCVPRRAPGPVWDGARVFLAPLTGWEHPPLTALAALAHGVPVVASDRGAAPELLDGAAVMLPLPERLTTAFLAPLTPAELAPWVETVLRLFDDSAFAAHQRGLALHAGRRWEAGALAPRYARLFAGLAGRRHRKWEANGSVNGTTNGVAKGSANGHVDPATAIRHLAESQPWPAERPADAAPGKELGWLSGGTEVMLSRALSPTTRLVVELGAWLGLSTRFIADAAPHATVVSVDHWQGSSEHQARDHFKDLLPRLYETFQARCWDYRDRVVPLRADTRDGLRAVAGHGLQPDFVYVDAEHSYEAVTAELALARELFPTAGLGGDDYDWDGVRTAVDEFAARHGLVVDLLGVRGWRLLEGWQAGDVGGQPPGRAKYVVLVPHLNGIEWECEQALRRLEQAGVRVVRRGGCSAIDAARNELISDALHDGATAMLFIDADIGFDPADALRLLARPEPVISGVYPKKGMRELASAFAPGVKEVLFGPDAVGPYPLKYAATGFLRVRAGVLRRMIADLRLPLCNTHWGRGLWPFFQPLIVPHGPDKWHYLGEDWSFSHRLGQIGVTPLADTSIRLWHWGNYGFGWEDAGRTVDRFRSYTYHLTGA
jgi:hypothetical protein